MDDYTSVSTSIKLEIKDKRMNRIKPIHPLFNKINLFLLFNNQFYFMQIDVSGNSCKICQLQTIHLDRLLK